MIKIKDIIKKLEELAPPELASFDYVGLVSGNPEKEVKTVCFALDLITAVDEAIRLNCDLLITHHNFGIGKGIAPSTELEKSALNKLIANDVGLYMAHLHLDFAEQGLIHNMCKLLGFEGKPADNIYEGKHIRGGVYIAETDVSFDEILSRIKALKVASIRTAGPVKKRYEKIAITTGAGFIPEFLEQLKPDAYIAGELTQEAICSADVLGITLIEITHSSEKLALKEFVKEFQKTVSAKIGFIDLPESLRVIRIFDGDEK